MNFDENMVVAQVERVTLRDLRSWVSEGWVRPAQGESGPIFDSLDIARVRLLCDLNKDMSLSTDTLPVVLNLIDHLHQTRRDLQALKQALVEQPNDVRTAVFERYRGFLSFSEETDGDS